MVSLGQASGWLLLADDHFLEAITKLELQAQKQYKAERKLAVVQALVLERIPANPQDATWVMGTTLSQEFRSWRRAKFYQQYRLFFRFDSRSRVIIYSWFNDDETLRAYGSKTDAYRVFESMLSNGKPPTSWQELLDSAK